jgi:hypothetical protein
MTARQHAIAALAERLTRLRLTQIRGTHLKSAG